MDRIEEMGMKDGLMEVAWTGIYREMIEEAWDVHWADEDNNEIMEEVREALCEEIWKYDPDGTMHRIIDSIPQHLKDKMVEV